MKPNTKSRGRFRPAPRGAVLDERDRDRWRAAVDACELEHAACDACLGVDGVRLDEPLREERHALGEEPHEDLVDRRVRPREAPQLRAAHDERLARLERGDRRAPLGPRSSTASSPNVSPGPRIARATVVAERSSRCGRRSGPSRRGAPRRPGRSGGRRPRRAGTCCGARARGPRGRPRAEIPSNSLHSMCVASVTQPVAQRRTTRGRFLPSVPPMVERSRRTKEAEMDDKSRDHTHAFRDGANSPRSRRSSHRGRLAGVLPEGRRRRPPRSKRSRRQPLRRAGHDPVPQPRDQRRREPVRNARPRSELSNRRLSTEGTIGADRGGRPKAFPDAGYRDKTAKKNTRLARPCIRQCLTDKRDSADACQRPADGERQGRRRLSGNDTDWTWVGFGAGDGRTARPGAGGRSISRRVIAAESLSRSDCSLTREPRRGDPRRTAPF